MKSIELPFAPGINYPLKYDRVIVPKVDLSILETALNNKTINVLCYGGLIESFFSLSYLEMFNKINPNREIFWFGDERFNYLAVMNGLAKFRQDKKITKKLIEHFPVPLFFDKIDNAYYSCLNNYLVTYGIDLKHFERNRNCLLKQMFDNCFLPWSFNYLPRLRNFGYSLDFVNWAKVNNFNVNEPYIIILPEKTGYSIHKKDHLEWDDIEIKSLSVILKQYGINTIVFGSGSLKWQGTNIYYLPMNLELIIPLIKNTRAVLSNEIDYHLVSMMISNAKIISKLVPKHIEMDLNFHKSFLGVNKKIFVENKLKPAKVFEMIKG